MVDLSTYFVSQDSMLGIRCTITEIIIEKMHIPEDVAGATIVVMLLVHVLML